MTCDSWRDGRDDDGWKLRKEGQSSNEEANNDSCEDYGDDDQEFFKEDTCNVKEPLSPITIEESLLDSRKNNDPPRDMIAVTRVIDDVNVLSSFLSPKTAPW